MFIMSNSTMISYLPNEHYINAEINNDIIKILHWIVFSIVCQSIVVLGTAANIINIICFVRQGFSESVNISLLGLAVADLGCLLTLVWTNICLNPSFMALDLPFISMDLQYMTGMPHTSFINVSSWITAIVTFERCLCITAPIQVKNIITTKRMSVIIIGLFIFLLSSVTPIYVVDKLDMKWVPEKNKSLLGLIRIKNREDVDRISSAIINIVLPFSSFTVVITCTIILVIKLNRLKKWREASTTSSQAEAVSRKNQKVSKMVVMISTLFICCFVPVRLLFMAVLMIPGFSIHGKYSSYLIVLSGIGLVLESLNSTLNIFFYYNMSSKYRAVFRQLFKMKQ